MLKGNPIISICIPLYNRAEYIVECINSIFNENFCNDLFECLIMDDSSTDNSVDIVRTYINNNPDKNIILFELDKNKGLWNARNELYSLAHGEYIMCVDADDKLAPGIIETLLKKIDEDHADMYIYAYSEIDNTGNIIKSVYNANNASTDLNLMAIDTYNFAVWNKLMRRDILTSNNIRVPDNVNCWEDVSVTSRVYALAQKIDILDVVGYYYRKHNSDAYTTHDHKAILEEHIRCTDFLDSWFKQKGLYIKYLKFINDLKVTAKIKLLRGSNFEIKRWLNTYPESNSAIMSVPGISFKYRLIFKLLSLLS